MKKLLRALSIALTAVLLTIFLYVPACAAGASAYANRSTVKTGESVTVSCTFNADITLFAFSGSLGFDPALVSYASGADSVSGSTAYVYPTLSGESSSYSFSVTFTAHTVGNAAFSFNGEGSDGVSRVSLSDSCSVTVTNAASQPTQPSSGTTPSASNNASLVSLRVAGAELKPAFDPNVTSYSVNVRYDVDKTAVSATAAAGASVMGAGNVDLNFGSNTRTLTVTAADGRTKKSYNINIRRMTKEETEAAQASERAGNPLSVTVDGKNLMIVPDISSPDVSALGTFEGYKVEKTKRGEVEVTYIKDNNGKYKLYYLTDEKGEGRYYNQTASGEFEEIYYIKSGVRLYIVKDIPKNVSAGGIYEAKPLTVEGITVPAWRFKQKAAQDIYIVYCYYKGEMGYYRYDSLEKTLSRAPEFAADNYVTASAAAESAGLIDRFKGLSTQGKTVLLLILLAAIAAVTVVVLLIVKIAKGGSGSKKKVNSKKSAAKKPAFDDIDVVNKDFSSNGKTGKEDDF